MTMNIIVTNQSATVIFNGKPYTVDRSHEKFDDLLTAYRAKDEEQLKKVIDSLSEVKAWAEENSGGTIQIIGGCVQYKGEVMQNAITERIMEWAELGLDPTPMMKFLERIMANPSYQSREELLLFLEQGKLPIMEDGRFLAYKVVRDNYLDKHTGTMDNSVGQIVEMPRSGVDDNRQNTCSAGLHFCSREYLSFFQGGRDRLMLLAIDPADVVSIPYDYNNAKGRACRYEVIEEINEAPEGYESPLYESQESNHYYLAVTSNKTGAVFLELGESDELFCHVKPTCDNIEDQLVYNDLKLAEEVFDGIDEHTLTDDGFGTFEECTVSLLDKDRTILKTKTIVTS